MDVLLAVCVVFSTHVARCQDVRVCVVAIDLLS